MRASFYLAAALGFAASSSAAIAATIVAVPNSTADRPEKVHNNNSGAGNLITLRTMPTGYLVDFSSTGPQIDAGAGTGFAQVTGSSGPNSGFSNLKIDFRNVANPTLGASSVHFKLDGLDVGRGRNVARAKSWDLKLLFAGGGSQSLSGNLFVPNDKYEVTAGAGETISALIFSNALAENDSGLIGTSFRSIKQVSFGAVLPAGVPEPSTWAMMIVGFGLTGAAMRSKPKRAALV